MQLKDYQEKTLTDLSGFLKRLGEFRARTEKANAALAAVGLIQKLADPEEEAWKQARTDGIHKSLRNWVTMNSSAGFSIPHVCIKLPTGGGKTFVAAHAVDQILSTLNGKQTGFVLWVTPSDAIYQQTLRQLRDRESPFRQVLERAAGGRVKILEKLDPFSKSDVEQRLCVMMLMLQSANRSKMTKGDLKIRSDSGSYPSFFPEEDDQSAHSALISATSNLERHDLGDSGGVGLIKSSLENTLRLIRPCVVLDEGHKAYSDQSRSTIADLNPSFLLELSATPKPEHSNILVNVSGQALKDAEMIKLPIELATVEKTDWQVTLERSLQKLDAINDDAAAFESRAGRYIRPILLVRVDRTGKDQHGGEYVHADDVVNYLTTKRGMVREAIKLQTADVKELRGEDLLSDTNPTRVIITKDALREGWDCPFAYVLCLLSSTQAKTALTQMIGRVLRQPHARITGIECLDRCYVFARDVAVREAVSGIKEGLEAEGMGDVASSIITNSDGPGQTVKRINIKRRAEFRGLAIMAPQVLHRRSKTQYEDIDYEAQVLRYVKWDELTYPQAETLDLKAFDPARQSTAIVDLDATVSKSNSAVIMAETVDRPGMARMMLDVVPNPWQGVRIIDEALLHLRERYTDADIARCRFGLVDDMKRVLAVQVDKAAEAVFRQRIKKGEIVFKLVGPPNQKLNWTVDQVLNDHVTDSDQFDDDYKHFLFERLYRKNLNGYEEQVAVKLDGNEAIKWWHRVASRGSWGLQGWRKHKVYPDFLVCLKSEGSGVRLLVLETKGDQLKGADDTEFKSKLFEILEAAYDKGHDVGAVELGAEGIDSMRFKLLFQNAWETELQAALAT